MNLLQSQRELVVKIAQGYLGKKRRNDFKCIDFVRMVYRGIDIVVPQISPSLFPPKEFNIAKEDLDKPPLGGVIFLRDRGDRRLRTWTHVGIIYSPTEIIHCSLYFGGCVVITPIQSVWERYDFVESI